MIESREAGRLPEMRPIVHGIPSHCPADYLGLVSPTDDLEPWRVRARERLGGG